jgi:hypothetical protein
MTYQWRSVLQNRKMTSLILTSYWPGWCRYVQSGGSIGRTNVQQAAVVGTSRKNSSIIDVRNQNYRKCIESFCNSSMASFVEDFVNSSGYLRKSYFSSDRKLLVDLHMIL